MPSLLLHRSTCFKNKMSLALALSILAEGNCDVHDDAHKLIQPGIMCIM